MELKATDHRYYCSDSNYYVGNYNGENFGRAEHETWEEFKEAWFFSTGNDHDYNHCFRYDIGEYDEGGYWLSLYMILQRKGIFRPVHIKHIEEKDMPEIEAFLKECWHYLEKQWIEISKV